jgi:phage tail sheath protein FI
LHRPRPEEQLALRSLVGENAGRSAARYVAPRRFALWMQACILEGTRWLCEESVQPALWERARVQVAAFLRELADAGCFAGRAGEERWFVICDARLNDAQSLAAGRRALLFGFALQRPGEFQCCLVSHTQGGSSTRAVTLNRLIEPGMRVAEQVETSLLRQLATEAALP